ncbi:MAG: nodulation protein NfeD [Acidimicrobiia bacterium]
MVAARARCRRVPWLAAVALGVVLTIVGPGGRQPAAAQSEDAGPVYVIEVTGSIDLGLAPYLDRVLGEADAAGASAVVVEIDTPGGRLDAVIQMRGALLDSPVRTIALVDSIAFSAGALVAIACEEIYMTPGSVMGAATPVLGGTGEVADEKTISAVRATFEATAEERGRDPRVAGAMVDPDVVVDGLVEEGELLTLTVSDAQTFGYTDGVVSNRDALLDELGLADLEVVETSPSLAEQLVRIITNPILASLLLTIGLLALIADLAGGGIGIGAVLGAGALATFFWGHMLAGLAGWEDAALVGLGLALIAVEVLVVPGFGVPGVLGLVALVAGGTLAMLYREFDFVTRDDLVRAGSTMLVTLVVVVAGFVLMVTALSRRRGDGLVLRGRVGVAAPVTDRGVAGWLRWFGAGDRLPASRRPPPAPPPDLGPGPGTAPVGAEAPSMVGATGVALSDLRPGGIAEIDGRRVDVVTSGEYLGHGEPIEVVLDEGYRRVVRRRRGQAGSPLP